MPLEMPRRCGTADLRPFGCEIHQKPLCSDKHGPSRRNPIHPGWIQGRAGKVDMLAIRDDEAFAHGDRLRQVHAEPGRGARSHPEALSLEPFSEIHHHPIGMGIQEALQQAIHRERAHGMRWLRFPETSFIVIADAVPDPHACGSRRMPSWRFASLARLCSVQSMVSGTPTRSGLIVSKCIASSFIATFPLLSHCRATTILQRTAP
jgi:hypothetical protein